MKTSLFILGSTRSGTSALRNALASTRYMGAGEGHTIGLLGALKDAVANHFAQFAAALPEGTMLAAWNRDQFWNQIVEAYVAQINQVFPGDHYLDKTPNISPLLYLDLIQSALPSPFFIFCRRRGIDNVLSKMRKWPETDFAMHCEEWRDIINHWDEVKQTLLCPWMEVEYQELYTNSQHTASRIGNFLGMSDDEIAAMHRSFEDGRPHRGNEAASIEDTGWSDAQKRIFLEVCGPVMERCGYGFYRYWRADT